MVYYELYVAGTKRDILDVRIIWNVDYNNIPTWKADLAWVNESVSRGDSIEIKRKNSQDASPVSIFKGLLEYKTPKMTNRGDRIMQVGGRHTGVKLWRKQNERNADSGGFWSGYYPHKIIEFLTRPTRSPKPQKIEDKWYRRIGWGIDGLDSVYPWVLSASSTKSGTSADSCKNRYNTIGWQSSVNNQNGQWIQVNLRHSVSVMGIRVENRWNEDWFRGYKIEVSSTGSFTGEQSQVASQSTNHARNIVESWSPQSCQYIRITGTVATSIPVFVGEIFVYESSGTISGISIGTLNQYLPLNTSEIIEDATSGQTYIKVRHTHRFNETNNIRIFNGTGNEATRKITSISAATNTLNLDASIGFAIYTSNNPWTTNLDASNETQLDYMRRTEAINKIAKLCIDASNEAWEWEITDDGAVNFADELGSDVSSSVSFDYASEIESSEHKQDDRKSIDSLLVLPRSGKDPDAQDRNSSGWIGTGDYEEVVWDNEVETQEQAISKAEALLAQATKEEDKITTQVDDDEVATGTWGIGDTVTINDTATGYSGAYRVVKLMRQWNESGETVTIEANSVKYTVSDLVYGISKDVQAGSMQQVYDDQWKRMQDVTSKPEYIFYYEAEKLSFNASSTTKTLDDTTSGGAYLKRTSGQSTADMVWGPGLTLNSGLFRARFWLKVASNVSSSTVATLKIYSSLAGGDIETLDVAPDDFTASDTWQGFTFLFAMETDYDDVQFVVSFTTGITDLSCDWMAIMVGGTDNIADIDLDYPEGAPAVPTGLTATGRPLGVLLEWTMNTEQDFSHYEIYKNTTNDSGTSTKIAECLSNWFYYQADSSEYNTTLYFWIKAVDWVGNASDFSTGDSALVGYVDTIEIALDAIDADRLQDLAVTEAKIADYAVSNIKIAADTIQAEKLKAGVQPFNSDIEFTPKTGDTHDSVTYTSGTVTFADGGTRSIIGANFDNLSTGTHYIYFTLASSALSESTTYSDAIGNDRGILAIVGVSSDTGQEVFIQPFYSKGLNVQADVIAANAIFSDAIQANAVVTDKLDAQAVTTAKLDALAVTTSRLDAGAVTAQKMTIYQILLDNPNFHISTSALAWDQHTLQYEGTSYTIASGSTNNTYIWWDEGDLSYSTSNTKPDIVADQTLHPVAIFDDINDDWWEVWKPTVVHGGMIVAETITATEITAEWITGKRFRTGTSGARVEFDSSGIYGYGTDGTTVMFYLQSSDGKAYAGAGAVILDDSGITVTGGSFDLQTAGAGNNRIVMDSTHIAGYDNLDVLQFELRSSDGEVRAGGGDIQMGDYGLHIYGQGLSFYDSLSTLRGYLYGDSGNTLLHLYATTDMRLAALAGGQSGHLELYGAGDIRVATDIIPGTVSATQDSTHTIGSDTVRFLDIYGDELHGDVFYADMNFLPPDFECPYCNKIFKEGDELVLVVRAFEPHDEYGEIMKAKPVHRSCSRIARMRRSWRKEKADR